MRVPPPLLIFARDVCYFYHQQPIKRPKRDLNPHAVSDLDFHTGLVPFNTEQAHSTLGLSSPANVPARSLRANSSSRI